MHHFIENNIFVNFRVFLTNQKYFEDGIIFQVTSSDFQCPLVHILKPKKLIEDSLRKVIKMCVFIQQNKLKINLKIINL